MIRPVRTAVIPAGGLGTRFLPFTRAIPKELLPLVDTPVIDRVVSDCAAAGIERIVIVGGPGKGALEAYFRPSPRLAERLEAEGRTAELEQLRRPEGLAEIVVVEQHLAKGNGHAVLVAREAVGDEPFAMLWGDDIVVGSASGVAQLIAARKRLGGGSVCAGMRVQREWSGRYGMFSGERVDPRTIRVSGIWEKPEPADAPGDLASVHGYVLDPRIFDVLEDQPPGHGGEIWLSDAVSRLAQHDPVWAIELEGRRYDAGDRAGYVAAFVDTALERPDTGEALREHLRQAGWKAPGER